MRETDPATTAASPDDPPDAVLAVEEAEASRDGEIRSGKLAGRSMGSAIWLLALPVLLQQLMTAAVGLVDKMVAGFLPEGTVVPALDGIGIGSYVGWFIGIAMAGLGVGGQAIIARAMGAGNRTEAEGAAGTALLLSVAWGALVGVALWWIVVPLAQVSGLEGRSLEFCVQYVRVLAVAMPFAGVMTVGSMCLHGAGETTAPSTIAIIVNVINVIATWVLSGVEGAMLGMEIPKLLPLDANEWGVLGIAAGTALSYIVGAALTVRAIFRGVSGFKPDRAHLAVDRRMGWRIARVGLPNFAEGIAMWAVNLFVLMFIGMVAIRRGASSEEAGGLVGAHMIAVQWEAFSFLPGFAMGIAAGALAGQYAGAGNVRKARRAIWACTWIGITIMGLMGILFMLAGEPLTRLISREPVHLAETPKLLFICGIVQVFFALSMVIRNGLRGVGDTTACLVITVISCYGVRLPAAWLLGVHFDLGLAGIWMALCGELVVRGLLFLWRFLSPGWERLRV